MRARVCKTTPVYGDDWRSDRKVYNACHTASLGSPRSGLRRVVKRDRRPDHVDRAARDERPPMSAPPAWPRRVFTTSFSRSSTLQIALHGIGAPLSFVQICYPCARIGRLVTVLGTQGACPNSRMIPRHRRQRQSPCRRKGMRLSLCSSIWNRNRCAPPVTPQPSLSRTLGTGPWNQGPRGCSCTWHSSRRVRGGGRRTPSAMRVRSDRPR